MNSRRPDGGAHYMSHASISRRRLLAVTGVAAAGGLSGCVSRAAATVTNTGASPAAVFAGEDESVGEPHVSRLTPTVSAAAGPLSGDVELEAWVTAVTLVDYNSPRSNRSAANLDEDSDDDGVGDSDYNDVLTAALDLENTLLSQTKAAAESISKRSPRTGRNQLSDMDDTINEVQATLAKCSDDVCVTVRENADVREELVQQAQRHVENVEWDEAARVVDEVRDIVEGDIERLENGNGSPIYESESVGGESALNRDYLAPPGGDPISDAERAALVEYLSGSPMIGERFTVCLPDAEVPGGNGSLAEEVTPQRFIDYITGRAANREGEIYAWGRAERVAGNGSGDCDDGDEDIHPGSDVCKPTHLSAAISRPVNTGGELLSVLMADVNLTVVNSPPKPDSGASVLVCPVDGEAYEPSDLSEWGSESGSSSETPTIVCQVMVQPPECPVPVRALLYVKRCRSDDQLVYTGGWVLDTAGLYEDAVTALTVAGETQIVGIECCFDYNADKSGLSNVVKQSVSGERALRGARIDSGTVEELVKSRVLSESEGTDILVRKKPGGRAAGDDGESGEHYRLVTHCPLDAPVLHLVNAGDASSEVKFKAGAELSKSVN